MRTIALLAALAAAACGDDKDLTGGGDTLPQITTAPATTPSTASGETGATGAEESTGGGSGSASAPTSQGPTSEATGPGPTTDEPPETSTGESTGEGSTVDSSETADPPKFDMGLQPDIAPPVCIECGLTIASMQSGVFTIEGGDVFATAQLQGQIVYAVGTHGLGRYVATADSSLPFNEVTDCPIWDWLAGNGGVQPKILYFGWSQADGPKQWSVPSDAAGIHLPAQYVGNAAQLRADYDIVMYLEGSGQFDNGDQPSDAEMDTLLDYMAAHGGGMYISSEFADPNSNAYLNLKDLMSVNRVLKPLGITAEQVSLNWGNVDGNIQFECFPEPQ